MPHIYADIEYLVFSFWLEPVKVEYYKYSWDFAAIFFDWEESQKLCAQNNFVWILSKGRENGVPVLNNIKYDLSRNSVGGIKINLWILVFYEHREI